MGRILERCSERSSERALNDRWDGFKNYKVIRPLIVEPCKNYAEFLYDGEIRILESWEAHDICGLIRIRRARDKNLISAVQYFSKESLTNIYANQVIELWREYEKLVYETMEESEILELLIFAVLRWQRCSSLLIGAWEAIRDNDLPVDVVCMQLFIKIKNTDGWKMVASEGVEMLHEW